MLDTATVSWSVQPTTVARTACGLDDRRERSARWKKESGHYLRKVPAVAGGVDQTACVDPRLTDREHLDVAVALERQLAGRYDHQLLWAMHGSLGSRPLENMAVRPFEAAGHGPGCKTSYGCGCWALASDMPVFSMLSGRLT
jgi:hypothetical protein